MKTVFIARIFAAFLLLASPAAAQFSDQATWGGTSGGTGNAQTITIANAVSLADLLGVQIKFSPGNSNSGATTLAVSGLAATAIRKPSPGGLLALAGGELIAGVPVVVVYNGTYFALVSSIPSPVSTQQVLTTGTGATYTTPALARQLRVTICGGGGGGGGSGSGGSGSTGGTTTFGAVTAIGGGGGGAAGGLATAAAGGVGGSGGSGSAQRFHGSDGMGGGISTSTANDQATTAGGVGGAGLYGSGAGSGGAGGVAGTAGASNTCAGGGGAGNDNTFESNVGRAGGGGAGEIAMFIINTPAASYTYTIGAGGTGGTGTRAGGAGGSGIILVDEFY